eukprot:Sdes_comp20854_c0_seq13m17664
MQISVRIFHNMFFKLCDIMRNIVDDVHIHFFWRFAQQFCEGQPNQKSHTGPIYPSIICSCSHSCQIVFSHIGLNSSASQLTIIQFHLFIISKFLHCNQSVGCNLMSQATTSTVDHNNDLANRFDSHHLSSHRIKYLIHYLNFGIMVSGPQCSQLRQSPFLGAQTHFGDICLKHSSIFFTVLFIFGPSISCNPQKDVLHQKRVKIGQRYPDSPSRNDQSIPSSKASSNCFIDREILPLVPTPTGIWSNKLWANSSLMGRISFSIKFVRINRTPQLISNPTPPGETIASGSDTSKAATFPIANPYPAWTSGSAILLPTMPGREATLAICFTAGIKPPLVSESTFCLSSSKTSSLKQGFTKKTPTNLDGKNTEA